MKLLYALIITFTLTAAFAEVAPTDISLSNTSVGSDLPIGTVVGFLSSTDPASGETHTYTLSGTDAASFAIDGERLITAAILDASIQSTYEITVTSTNSQGATFDKAFTITAVSIDFTQGLRGEFRFTNGDLTNPFKSSAGFAPDAVAIGSPTVTANRFSQPSRALEISEGNYARIPSNVFGASTSFMINTWFKLNADITSSNQIIIDSRINPQGQESGGFTIALDPDEKINVNFYIYPSSQFFTNVLSMQSTESIVPNEWNMLSISKTGTRGITVYLNGKIILAGELAQIQSIPPYDPGDVFTLGASGNGNATLNGALDDISFYGLFNPTLINALYTKTEPANVGPQDIQLSNTSVSENLPIETTIGTLSTTDLDEADTHTYTLSGADAASFSIDGNELRAAQVFDFETKASFSFTVTTEDPVGAVFDKDFIVTVTDVTEPTCETISTLTEDFNSLGLGLLPDCFSSTSSKIAADPNFNRGQADGAAIVFNGIAGTAQAETLSLPELDDIRSKRLSFFVKNNSASARVMNVYMSDTQQASGQVLAESIDIENTGDWEELVVDFSQFSIFSNFKNVIRIEFENDVSNGAQVLLDDLVLQEVNVAPFNIAIGNSSPTTQQIFVTENNTIGDSLAFFTSEDVNINETFTYSLSGADAAKFAMDGDILRAEEVLDFEASPTLQIEVTTTDAGGLSYSETFTINLLDAPEVGPNQEYAYFSFNDGSFFDEINNLEARNTEVSGSGKDQTALYPTFVADRFNTPNSALQFNTDRSLTVNDPLSLNTGSSSFNLWAMLPADITSGTQYLLYGSTPGTSATLELYITSEEKARLRFRDFGGIVLDMETSSSLTPGRWHMFTAVIDFEAGNVRLYLDASEEAVSVPTGFVPPIQWSFGSSNGSNEWLGIIDDIGFYEKALSTTEITDLYSIAPANSAPTALLLDATDVDENEAIGTIVGELSTTDSDQGDFHTYSLSGADAASFVINGNNLETAEIFDFETKSSYGIDITTTDALGASFTDSFTITVNDLDENNAPTDISLTSESVVENQVVSTLVARISTTDADAADTHTYALSGADAASFNIGIPVNSETSTLGLITSAVFDYETKSSYSIEITTDDGNGGTFTKAFTITVEDENEAPTQINFSNNTISENEAVGSFVGTFETNDPDAGDSHTVTISGEDAGSFSLSLESNNARTGAIIPSGVYVLRSNEVFDFEAKSSYSIEVTSTDAGNLSITSSFTINIEDVANESNAPTDILLSNVEVQENQPAGTLVGTLSTIDPDAGDTHTYTLGGDQSSSFEVDGSNVLTAEVFDVSDRTSYEIEITADDGNGGIFTKAFIITVLEEETTVLSVGNEIKVDYYPNPVTEQLVLQGSSTTTYKLVTLSGNVLKSNAISNGQVTLDLRSIPSGNYLLILQDGENKRTEKIIKR